MAYHAIRAGQSFSIEITKADTYDARYCQDTAKRVYHGTSLAGANLIMKGGFIGCAPMKVLFVVFNLTISSFSFLYVFEHVSATFRTTQFRMSAFQALFF